jgi:hypothetical protein
LCVCAHNFFLKMATFTSTSASSTGTSPPTDPPAMSGGPTSAPPAPTMGAVDPATSVREQYKLLLAQKELLEIEANAIHSELFSVGPNGNLHSWFHMNYLL